MTMQNQQCIDSVRIWCNWKILPSKLAHPSHAIGKFRVVTMQAQFLQVLCHNAIISHRLCLHFMFCTMHQDSKGHTFRGRIPLQPFTPVMLIHNINYEQEYLRSSTTPNLIGVPWKYLPHPNEIKQVEDLYEKHKTDLYLRNEQPLSTFYITNSNWPKRSSTVLILDLKLSIPQNALAVRDPNYG